MGCRAGECGTPAGPDVFGGCATLAGPLWVRGKGSREELSKGRGRFVFMEVLNKMNMGHIPGRARSFHPDELLSSASS